MTEGVKVASILTMASRKIAMGYMVESNAITRVLQSRDRGRRRKSGKDVKAETRSEVCHGKAQQCALDGSEVGGRSREPRNVGSLSTLEKERNLQNHQNETQPF